jgi:hypothetical protein
MSRLASQCSFAIGRLGWCALVVDFAELALAKGVECFVRQW